MAVISQFRELSKDSRNAFISALLGWTMDAFDYFLVVLVYADIAEDFGVSLTKMAFLTTVTLLMRPVVLRVDAAAMAADGHCFTVSANGVWLTDAVPARYLRVSGD